jgi:hypothetical protein
MVGTFLRESWEDALRVALFASHVGEERPSASQTVMTGPTGHGRIVP